MQTSSFLSDSEESDSNTSESVSLAIPRYVILQRRNRRDHPLQTLDTLHSLSYIPNITHYSRSEQEPSTSGTENISQMRSSLQSDITHSASPPVQNPLL